jgi:hypothetical protein
MESRLPKKLPVNTGLYFTKATGWTTIYAVDGRPVLLERRTGKGSIVLVADSYLLSNEAMRNKRQPALIAWLVGVNKRIIFDETHLGVMDNPGIMSLIKKYRLFPFLGGLLLLVLLVLWRFSIRFIPEAEEPDLRRVSEKDRFSGLVSLLRRHISSKDLIETCYHEWSRSASRILRNRSKLTELVQQIIKKQKTEKADPVAAHKAITDIVVERKRV